MSFILYNLKRWKRGQKYTKTDTEGTQTCIKEKSRLHFIYPVL